MQEQWVYVRDGWQPVPPDDCGYRAQADRIADYQALHIPESVIPYAVHPDDFPDGCSMCGKATVWESRELPNGCLQTRCTGCRSVSTFGL